MNGQHESFATFLSWRRKTRGKREEEEVESEVKMTSVEARLNAALINTCGPMWAATSSRSSVNSDAELQKVAHEPVPPSLPCGDGLNSHVNSKNSLV